MGDCPNVVYYVTCDPLFSQVVGCLCRLATNELGDGCKQCDRRNKTSVSSSLPIFLVSLKRTY